MRKGLAIMSSTGVIAALALAMGGASASADPTGICPDDHMPVPTAAAGDYAKKDRNGDGVVCLKYKNGTFVGGPDDRPPLSDVVDAVDNVLP